MQSARTEATIDETARASDINRSKLAGRNEGDRIPRMTMDEWRARKTRGKLPRLRPPAMRRLRHGSLPVKDRPPRNADE